MTDCIEEPGSWLPAGLEEPEHPARARTAAAALNARAAERRERMWTCSLQLKRGGRIFVGEMQQLGGALSAARICVTRRYSGLRGGSLPPGGTDPRDSNS